VEPAKRRPLEAGDHEVVLTAAGNRPINVVKAVRELADLSLIDAKIVVEKPGGVLIHGRSEASCARIVQMLSAAGATASTRRTCSSTSE
jgi:large subunit ribosomal protein L7/L12